MFNSFDYVFVLQPRLPSQKIPFKRAEKFVKEFRLRQKDSVRISRQARRCQPVDSVSAEPKLIVAVRTRKYVVEVALIAFYSSFQLINPIQQTSPKLPLLPSVAKHYAFWRK